MDDQSDGGEGPDGRSGIRRSIPSWFFFAISRAITRTLYQKPVRLKQLFQILPDELKANQNAMKVYGAFPPRVADLIVRIIVEILKGVDIVRQSDGTLELSRWQRVSRVPKGFPNDLLGEIYGEYLRWTRVRPQRYAPMLHQDVSFLFMREPVEAGETPAFERAPDFAIKLTEEVRKERYARQRVFFATSHVAVVAAETDDMLPDLSYGEAWVSIPDLHIPGKFERPAGFGGLEMREDPELHIVIIPGSVEERSSSEFLDNVRSESKKSVALVFVHGYNMTRDDAIRRTGQIAHDLAFQGAAIAFLWPSRGSISPLDYVKDSDDAIASGPGLAELILDLRSTGIEKVHIIAHSMGGKVLAEASRALKDRGGHTAGSLVFAAPDVDQRHFRNVRDSIASCGQQVTLYASSRDKALLASKKFNGNVRAGDASPLLICDGIDSVDATAIDTDWLGHGYFAADINLLEDIELSLNLVRPPRHVLQDATNHRGERYWRFP